MVEKSRNPGRAKFSNHGILVGFGGVLCDIHIHTTPWESFTSYVLVHADRGIFASAGSCMHVACDCGLMTDKYNDTSKVCCKCNN